MTMASRIAVMSEGRFLQVGAPADIYETPATRFVADFIGNVNLMEGSVEVDEPEIREAVRLLSALANVKAEPTGALTTGAVLTAPERFRDQRVCCVVSGGNVDPQVYLDILSGAPS